MPLRLSSFQLPVVAIFLLSGCGLGHVCCEGQAYDDALLWSSTGGGWRAMFADVGYANVFHQAGLMTKDSTRFTQLSTVSGGSWFSTQLTFSPEFYNQTVLAESPDDLQEFVIRWMTTYSDLAGDIDNETAAKCDTSDVGLPLTEEVATNLQDVCELAVQYDDDWALFIQAMLQAASADYGDPGFVGRLALPGNRIPAMAETDLLIQSALMPVSRIRDAVTSTATVYFGRVEGQQLQVFTVPLSAAYVVQTNGSKWVYGLDDLVPAPQPYLGRTPATFDWGTWSPFWFFADRLVGTVLINTTMEALGGTTEGMANGVFREPFGGIDATTVLQIAAISSAAGGNGSPLVATVYAQTFSIGVYFILQKKMATVWKVLAGIAAGLGAGVFFGFGVGWMGVRFNWCVRETAHKWGYGIGIVFGLLAGLLTGIFVGFGSILVPTIFDNAVNKIYTSTSFDKFSVCSQWPNTCDTSDGQFIDGWFIDNPALVINIGHYQQKSAEVSDKVLKVIITNTNEEWNTTFNYAQLLQYFSTDFNQNVPPGDFLWAPGYYAPFRSPQIFSEYLDEHGLDALLEPIPGSNMTTAILKGTTVANPSFLTKAGQKVEMLLLNLNENITTLVIGKAIIDENILPLANMTKNIAANEILVQRVRDFAGASSSSNATDDDFFGTVNSSGVADGEVSDNVISNSSGVDDLGDNEVAELSNSTANPSQNRSLTRYNSEANHYEPADERNV